MERDETFVADTAYHFPNTAPMANAIGVVTDFHKLQGFGYSFGWDGDNKRQHLAQ
jgi:hypothetical protein